jgi:hypothetical protein
MGEAWLSRVQGISEGNSVAQKGAAKLRMVQLSSEGAAELR